MDDTQKENLVVVATAVAVGLAALAVGKVTGRLGGMLMTRKFDKAVNTKAGADVKTV